MCEDAVLSKNVQRSFSVYFLSPLICVSDAELQQPFFYGEGFLDLLSRMVR